MHTKLLLLYSPLYTQGVDWWRHRPMAITALRSLSLRWGGRTHALETGWGKVYISSKETADHHHQKLQGAGESTGREEEARALYYDTCGRQWYMVIQNWRFGIKTDLPSSPGSLIFFSRWVRLNHRLAIPRNSLRLPSDHGVVDSAGLRGLLWGLDDTRSRGLAQSKS